MPETYLGSTIIASDPPLNPTTAILTDGRFSGAMKGPCIGHVTPEALDGGPIALVEENDLIEIHVPRRGLALFGFRGQGLPGGRGDLFLGGRRHAGAPRPRGTGGGFSPFYA